MPATHRCWAVFSPMHVCIDNFIHTYAGIELRLKMHEIMLKQGHEEETEKAKITPGYIICRRNTFFIQLAPSYGGGGQQTGMKICWPAVIKNA